MSYTYTSDFVKRIYAYEGDVTDLCTGQYPVGASTSTSTDNYNYIESTSADGGKAEDCCTDINHFSGVHADYLYLNHSTFTYMSTLNYLVNVLLRLSPFSIPDKDTTNNNIISTGFIGIQGFGSMCRTFLK